MKFLLVGGSGGIGTLLQQGLKADCLYTTSREVISLSSKDCNVTVPYQVQGELEYHMPDVLINLAAISIDSPLDKASKEEIEDQIEVNILGNINLVQEFIKVSKERKYGTFIYISSILSEAPVKYAGIYSATKAFNDNLIKTASMENAKHGITFHSIQLGYMGSGLCDRLPDRVKTDVLDKIPLKRWGEIDELVNLIDYFVSTPYSTGSIVKLAGGL